MKDQKPQTRIRAENAPPRKRQPSENQREDLFLEVDLAMSEELLLWCHRFVSLEYKLAEVAMERNAQKVPKTTWK
ncbi:hypothetical protein G2W53_036684 [Senna tora]|uniref:Uncharacterized protein n=1 Tax=Senna tora TaxID=362788 RepID=A0A834SVL8_9FABA|nr:hypothetical protein G2W53_036684 [Senna tora]